MLLTTSLSLLKANNICESGYDELVNRLGPDFNKHTPIPIGSHLAYHSTGEVLWALRAVSTEQQTLRDKVALLIACDIAGLVLPIFEDRYPKDNRPRNAIEVARKFANGLATVEELEAASADSYAASYFSYVAIAAASAAYSAATTTTCACATYSSAVAATNTSHPHSSPSIVDFKSQVREIIRLHLSG